MIFARRISPKLAGRPRARRVGLSAIAIAALSACFGFSVAQAGDVFAMAGDVNARVKVKSIAERKFGAVIRQQYDFSCGSAAVATLLTYHYDRTTSEQNAFRSMWEVGDQSRIRELGFSLFEMKSYLETLGLTADGFKLTLERVEEIGVPGIALINSNGYKHFVVIKGLTPRTVLVGDPSKGVIGIPREKFMAEWDGVILFIRSDVARGKANFNKIADWKLAPSGPMDRAQELESLQEFTLSQTRPSFSGFSIPFVINGSQP